MKKASHKHEYFLIQKEIFLKFEKKKKTIQNRILKWTPKHAISINWWIVELYNTKDKKQNKKRNST